MGEEQYLGLLDRVLNYGDVRSNRTGIDTISLFGEQVQYDLTNNKIPRLTTRRISDRIAFEELMFFLRGHTNTQLLREKNVHIWDADLCRDTLDKRGFEYVPEFEMPYGYGHQWRHYGGSYEDGYKSDEGQDQVANVLKLLCTDKYNRRIILNSWNPCDIHKMALPPCHVMYQWVVNSRNKVTCILTMRSNDLPLGHPTNILTASLMTRFFCDVAGLTPDRLVVNMGDAHIYKNQVPIAQEQITRLPFDFPRLKIKKSLKNLGDILSLEYSDLEYEGYDCHEPLKYPMSF